MGALESAGPIVLTDSREMSTRKYPNDLLPGLTTTQVDDRINATLAGKVLKSYVDAKAATLATTTFMNAGDATRMKTADKDVANGILALGPSGRAASNRFNVSTTQRWGTGIWTPSSYGTVSAITAESTVFPMTISDPGFAYK